MNVFPPCAENTQEFTLQYIVNGPMCLLTSGFTFVCFTLAEWETSDGFERKAAISVFIILQLFWCILLPLFLVLELVKLSLYPIGLLAYILTKKYYQSYPIDSSSSSTMRNSCTREIYMHSSSRNICKDLENPEQLDRDVHISDSARQLEQDIHNI